LLSPFRPDPPEPDHPHDRLKPSVEEERCTPAASSSTLVVFDPRLRSAILSTMRDHSDNAGLWDDVDTDDISPICDSCGVSALPPEAPGEPSICENPNCSRFGSPIAD
jgi:hypothetical protein